MALDHKMNDESMNVDVIATFAEKRNNAKLLMNAQQLLHKSQQQVGVYQAHFEIDMIVDHTMTYDAVMMAVREEVERVCEQVLGIKPSEIVKISTCADWRVWEQLTGRSSAEDDAVSAVCRHGKFWF